MKKLHKQKIFFQLISSKSFGNIHYHYLFPFINTHNKILMERDKNILSCQVR